MKEGAILFSGPMIPPVLEDRKTQTRRVVKLPRSKGVEFRFEGAWKDGGPTSPFRAGEYLHMQFRCMADGDDGWGMDTWDRVFCPIALPGDRLRVKEAAWMWCERRPNGMTASGRPKWHYVPLKGAPIHYVADHPKRPASGIVSPVTGNVWGWRFKTGRFLPKWASRIMIEVTGIRVERLHEITDDEALAEGVTGDEHDADQPLPRMCFERLWQSINGPDSWEANPYVWVIEFRRIKAP